MERRRGVRARARARPTLRVGTGNGTGFGIGFRFRVRKRRKLVRVCLIGSNGGFGEEGSNLPLLVNEWGSAIALST